MNEFYKSVSKSHIKKLEDEYEYYHIQAEENEHNSENSKEGYALMADFYCALIAEARKHVAEHS